MSEPTAALRRSLSTAVKIDQGMLRYVLDQSRDCIKILDPEGHIEYVNSEARCALGISNPAAVCGRSWPSLWPAESRPAINSALEKASRGEGVEIEAWRPNSSGDKTWWRISVSPLAEADGELAGILTLSRDVTSHVTLRESEQTLVLEMRHRLRNAYTVASAIVMQSARDDATMRTFAEAVCGRLADVALSQTRLLEAGEKSWALPELIRVLVEAHGEGPQSVRYAGDASATIDGHQAMLVALVIGELTNNSLKYGALRHRRPITLSWSIEGQSLALNWSEPLAAAKSGPLQPRDAGSGYSMMQRMAKSQRASFEHQISNGELQVSLKLHRRSDA